MDNAAYQHGKYVGGDDSCYLPVQWRTCRAMLCVVSASSSDVHVVQWCAYHSGECVLCGRACNAVERGGREGGGEGESRRERSREGDNMSAGSSK